MHSSWQINHRNNAINNHTPATQNKWKIYNCFPGSFVVTVVTNISSVCCCRLQEAETVLEMLNLRELRPYGTHNGSPSGAHFMQFSLEIRLLSAER